MTTTAATVFNGGFASNDGSTITTADNTTQLALVSTDADAAVGPVLDFYRNSSSPADNDLMGVVNYKAENSAGETITYANMIGILGDVTDGTEDGQLRIQTMTAGSNVNRISFNTAETVINDNSVDSDFRVESNNLTHALFVQGSDGNVGIGTASPATTLTVTGSGANGLELDRNIAAASQSARLFFDSSAGGTAIANYDGSTVFTTGATAGSSSGTERARIDSK